MRKRPGGQELHLHELAQYWNWLPAFRAVAESGGVNEAARILHVSPSALSRGVGLLEAALRVRLFHREGGLVPTAEGTRLLTAVREAMRLIHDATRPGTWASTSIGLGATSRLGAFRLLATLHALRRRFPELAVHVSTVRTAEVAPLLLRGQLDLVVTTGAVAPKGVVGRALPPAPCHVYCGLEHPLHRAKKAANASVDAHAFAVPSPAMEGGVSTDGWPLDQPRLVGMVADSLEPAIDAAVRGDLLIALPDEVVTSLGLTKKLAPLAKPALASLPLQAVHRAPLGPPDLVAAVAAHLAAPESELDVPVP